MGSLEEVKKRNQKAVADRQAAALLLPEDRMATLMRKNLKNPVQQMPVKTHAPRTNNKRRGGIFKRRLPNTVQKMPVEALARKTKSGRRNGIFKNTDGKVKNATRARSPKK